MQNNNGSSNSAFGYSSLYSNTTGNANSSFGQSTLSSNITGLNNSAFGYQSMLFNTTGLNNSAFGHWSSWSNTTGNYNAAFGRSALYSNTVNSFNSAFGYKALFLSTGGYNIGLGYNAGSAITTGANNVVIGGSDGLSIATLTQHIIISDGTGVERIQISDLGVCNIVGSLLVNGAPVGGGGGGGGANLIPSLTTLGYLSDNFSSVTPQTGGFWNILGAGPMWVYINTGSGSYVTRNWSFGGNVGATYSKVIPSLGYTMIADLLLFGTTSIAAASFYINLDETVSNYFNRYGQTISINMSAGTLTCSIYDSMGYMVGNSSMIPALPKWTTQGHHKIRMNLTGPSANNLESYVMSLYYDDDEIISGWWFDFTNIRISDLTIGATYKISNSSGGPASLMAIGAPTGTIGEIFVATSVGTVTDTLSLLSLVCIPATQMVLGRSYMINSVGTTNFTLHGATSNIIETPFTATGAGVGTGTVKILCSFGANLFVNSASNNALMEDTAFTQIRIAPLGTI